MAGVADGECLMRTHGDDVDDDDADDDNDNDAAHDDDADGGPAGDEDVDDGGVGTRVAGGRAAGDVGANLQGGAAEHSRNLGDVIILGCDRQNSPRFGPMHPCIVVYPVVRVVAIAPNLGGF